MTTREYADGTEPTHLPHMAAPRCSGPCQQGRAPCPNREACWLEDDPDFYGREEWLDLLRGVVLVAVLAGSALLVGVLVSRGLA
jgi:hypothetical protein